MAVMNWESLVLRGVNAVRGVVTGLERIDSKRANRSLPAMDLSLSRHPSQQSPQAGLDAGTRYGHADTIGAATATLRAGRPESCRVVLDRRSPASSAGRAVLSGWSLATGEPCPTVAALGIGRMTGGNAAAVGMELPERALRFMAPAMPPTGSMAAKRRKPRAAWSRPHSARRSPLRRGDS